MHITEEAINITLKMVHGSPELWLDPKKGVSTRFVTKDQPLRRQLSLLTNERPLFEYASADNYSLVTSKRVVSDRKDGGFATADLSDIATVRPFFSKPLSEDQGPMKILRVIGNDGDEFLIEFDSGTPAYFACMLITNLSWYITKGRWFINPTG